MPTHALPEGWREVVARSLAEDLGSGDVSSSAFAPDLMLDWYIEAQADGMLAGVPLAAWLLTPDEIRASDGDRVTNGTNVMNGRGPAAHVLSRERPALNFLMHLGGIATATARYVAAVEGTGARIVDTRKTVPGLRGLAKYAVRCGGGANHRFGLFDGAMVKDNHIRAFGGIAPAVAALRRTIPHTLRIEVECESAGQVAEAISAGAEVVMLDNMAPEAMALIVSRHRGQAVFEASGGITLATVRAVAETGVDLISVGAVTHSAPALSLHLEIA